MKKIPRIDLSSKSYPLRRDGAEEAAHTIIRGREEKLLLLKRT